jgi:hypothetical protein
MFLAIFVDGDVLDTAARRIALRPPSQQTPSSLDVGVSGGSRTYKNH